MDGHKTADDDLGMHLGNPIALECQRPNAKEILEVEEKLGGPTSRNKWKKQVGTIIVVQ